PPMVASTTSSPCAHSCRHSSIAYCHTPPTVSADIRIRRGAPPRWKPDPAAGSATIDPVHQPRRFHQLPGVGIVATALGEAPGPVDQCPSAPGIGRSGQCMPGGPVEAVHLEVV